MGFAWLLCALLLLTVASEYYCYRSTQHPTSKLYFNIILEKKLCASQLKRCNRKHIRRPHFSSRGRIFQFPSIGLISVSEWVSVCTNPIRLDSMIIIIIIRWEEFSRIDEFKLKWKKTSCRRNGKKRNKHEWQTEMPRCGDKKRAHNVCRTSPESRVPMRSLHFTSRTEANDRREKK